MNNVIKSVYIISNPAYPGMLKVGIATSVRKRLGSYQTSDPNRAYKLEYSIETEHWDEIEKNTHKHFPNKREWVVGDTNEVQTYIEKQLENIDYNYAMHKAMKLVFAYAIPKIKAKLKLSKLPAVHDSIIDELQRIIYFRGTWGEMFKKNKLAKFTNNNLESIIGFSNPFESSWSFEDMGLDVLIKEIISDSNEIIIKREAISEKMRLETNNGCFKAFIIIAVIIGIIIAIKS